MDVNVYDLKGTAVGTLKLDKSLWEGPVNLGLLSQALAMYRTNLRNWLASTKRRGEISGGGKKPWKQKHTGRARAGSTRSPLWRHGGSTFGPKPRDSSYRLPQAIRRKALLESLKGKLQDKELIVVDGLKAEKPKAKPFSKLADAFNVQRKSVVVLQDPSEALVKSLRNLAFFKLRQAEMLTAFDVMNSAKLLIAKEAFDQVEQRVRCPETAEN